MKSQVNPVEICGKFNTARMENLHKKLTPEELNNILAAIGMSNAYRQEAKKRGFFRFRKIGTKIEYCFTDTPINKGQFIKLYEDMRKSFRKQKNTTSTPTGDEIDKAIKLLKQEGYIIYRNDGLDENALKAEHPDIYKKYQVFKQL